MEFMSYMACVFVLVRMDVAKEVERRVKVERSPSSEGENQTLTLTWMLSSSECKVCFASCIVTGRENVDAKDAYRLEC